MQPYPNELSTLLSAFRTKSSPNSVGLYRVLLQSLQSNTFPVNFTVGGRIHFYWKVSRQKLLTQKIKDHRLMDANMNLSRM